MDLQARFEWKKSDPLKQLNIGVLYGGPSAEHKVSLASGEAVAQALTAAGRRVHRVLLDGSFNAAMARDLELDVAFLALHGEFGEDGRVQLILEEADIPYIGSGPDASANAFDKVLTKRILEQNGVLTPAWTCCTRSEYEGQGGEQHLDLVPPVVLKPAASGSSLGVTIVRRCEDFAAAYAKAFQYSDTAIIERFVEGRELTVAMLGDDPLPVIEIKVEKSEAETFDFYAKYESNKTQEICPAELPAETTARAQATALATHRALGCRDVSRTDMILDAQGLCWVLETNTLPGLTSHSLLPKAAAAVGMDFVDLCEFLLCRAVQRSRAKKA